MKHRQIDDMLYEELIDELNEAYINIANECDLYDKFPVDESHDLYFIMHEELKGDRFGKI